MILTAEAKDYGIAGLSLIIVGGVVRAYMNRTKGGPGRLRALEVEVRAATGEAKARVVDLEKLLEEKTTAIDNKQDIILEEMKAMHCENRDDIGRLTTSFNEAYRLLGERLARVEENIKHIQEDQKSERARGPRR